LEKLIFLLKLVSKHSKNEIEVNSFSAILRRRHGRSLVGDVSSHFFRRGAHNMSSPPLFSL